MLLLPARPSPSSTAHRPLPEVRWKCTCHFRQRNTFYSSVWHGYRQFLWFETPDFGRKTQTPDFGRKTRQNLDRNGRKRQNFKFSFVFWLDFGTKIWFCGGGEPLWKEILKILSLPREGGPSRIIGRGPQNHIIGTNYSSVPSTGPKRMPRENFCFPPIPPIPPINPPIILRV